MKSWESEDKSVQLFLGDCREQKSSLDFDLILTDPPYGISHPCNFAKRGRDCLAKCKDYPNVVGAHEPFDPSEWLALKKPTILWGGNHFASRLPDSNGWLVWDKKRPDTLDQATCELAWTNVVKGVRRFSHLWHGCMKARERGESYHPTQKPVALMSWCLSLKWTQKLRTVFDPFMGCGPVGVACVQLGLPFIGVEIEPAYFKIAKQRIQKALKERDEAKQP